MGAPERGRQSKQQPGKKSSGRAEQEHLQIQNAGELQRISRIGKQGNKQMRRSPGNKEPGTLAEQRKRLAPKPAEAFAAFSRSVFADGALPVKTKQLIAVAVAHVTQFSSEVHHACRCLASGTS